MNLKQTIKRGLKLVFGKRPTVIQANVVKLAPSELLKGRTALITGGTSGIGFAIADAMLDAGAGAVVITSRNENRCKVAVDKLTSKGNSREGKVFYQVMDNRNAKSFRENFDTLLSKLPSPCQPVSILVNNAGVQGAQFGSAEEEDFDNVMDTNYKGVFFLSQLVAHYMVDNHIKGNILNIASSSSLRPANNAYTLSKGCIKELTTGMAKTLIKHGIVMNGVAPGPTATPMIYRGDGNIKHDQSPLGRFALPEEIANMAVFLTSGMGRTIVGSIVYMTGGAGTTTVDDIPYNF